MKFGASILVICCLTFGTPIGANIIDNIIMRNWKSKETKLDDPFFNPFGLPFPFFSPADDPMSVSLKNDREPRATRKEGRKAKLPKPWFSISEFLNLPETSRKTKSEARKQDDGSVGGSTAETTIPEDKITQTGDLGKTKSPTTDPSVEGLARKTREVEDQKPEDHGVPLEFDFVPDHDLIEAHDNHTKSKPQPKFSYPKGLSDILIIFQKVGSKPKSHQLISSANTHECDELCPNGICELSREIDLDHDVTMNTDGTPGTTTSEMPRLKKTTLLAQYDRICILAIPIALGIGTLLFIYELRRVFKRMKKQAVLSTFDHQEC